MKTPSSYRSIEVTQTFLDYLKALKLKQDEGRRCYGDAYKDENVVWDRREKNQDEKIIVSDFINIKQNGAMLTSDSEKFMARIKSISDHRSAKHSLTRTPVLIAI